MAVCKKNVRSQETGHNFQAANYYIRVIAGHGVIQTTLIRALNLEVGNIDNLCVVPCGYLKGKCYLRVSMGLTVRRKTAKNLAVRRKNERILAVSRKKK